MNLEKLRPDKYLKYLNPHQPVCHQADQRNTIRQPHYYSPPGRSQRGGGFCF